MLFLLVLIFFTALSFNLYAQNDTIRLETDTLPEVSQSNDTIRFHLGDTIVNHGDTAKVTSGKKSTISSQVIYSATDSVSLDLENQKVFLYRDADIKYESIQEKAAFISLDFGTNILTALPKKDSLGKEYGLPEFSEGDQTFKAKEMRYNFKTKEGISKGIITQEGQGYLHGDVVKKMEDNVSNMKGGGYTTCSLDDPHFSLRFTKAKVIPNNKIVTGPAFMEIEGVPIPIVLPFGLFPNRRGQTSGILIPTYGESRDRGFYLENGGYYFGINEYMELRMVGDIYSRGSWALKPVFNYRKRYKFSGNFNFNYSINTSGVKETNSYQKTKDFRINWSHRQDPKARPNSQFSASVNFGSRTYNRYNPVSVADHLTNTFGSSISYSTTLGEKVTFSSALKHSQNTSNKTIQLTIPEIALGVNRFYPLRAKNKVSDLKWYDNISVNYSMVARNELNTYDSLLFSQNLMNQFRNGVQHRIPVSLSLKVLKYFSLNTSIDFSEKWYSKSILKRWVTDTLYTDRYYYVLEGDTWIPIEQEVNDSVVHYVDTDTITGFKAVHEYGFNTSLNTTLYGMLQFRKGPLRAIRHVMKPSVSFSFRPDFSDPRLGYYRDVQTDTLGTITRYSIFGGGSDFSSVYGSPPIGRSGRVSFSIGNNLEMKVRSKSDTISGMKKVKLIESFSLSTSYDLAKDTLKWSPLSLSARTTLFKNLQIQYSAVYDPYVKTNTGKTINKFEWDANHRLFRKENSSWNFSLSYSFGSGKKSSNKPMTVAPTSEAEAILRNPDEYINWNNPWNFSFSYNLVYNSRFLYSNGRQEQKDLVQTLSFNGDVNVTPKWKVNVISGYDFELHKLSYTSMSVYRDLHCWEMRFNWIPTGYLKSWNFYIRVKADILQDLKLNRKKDFRDN